MVSLRNINWAKLLFELFVVIVGVLIAVGIDDYLSSLSKKKTTKNYLKELLEDLEQDSSQIEFSIRFAQSKEKGLENLLDSFWLPNASDLDLSDLVNRNFYYIATENNINFQDYTLQALKETGTFDNLNNDPLIQQIASYEKYCNLILQVDASDNRFVRDVIENFLYENIPLGKCFPFSTLHSRSAEPLSAQEWITVFHSKELDNLILSSLWRIKMTIDKYQHVQHLNINLRDKIKEYLELN